MNRFRIVQWWRQLWCGHAFYIDDMETLPSAYQHETGNRIECACNRCGRVFEVPYGLVLPGKRQRRAKAEA